jgi:hypothetical protein
MSLINRFISEEEKILSRQINRLTLKQQRFIRKEKLGKRASDFLSVKKTLSAALLHGTVVDSPLTTATYEPLLMYKLQQQFHEEPMLIL